MILLIDNYDSFSYNLYQLIGQINPEITVVRNNEISIDEIKKLAPQFIVISPGAGKPAGAGICLRVIKEFYQQIPILGICLGHQAIYEAFGGTVSYADQLVHGKSEVIRPDPKSPLFRGLDPVINVARYHSLIGVEATLPNTLKIIARSEDREIMGVCHREYPTYGLQFHPESILTLNGREIIENFLSIQDIRSEKK